MFLIHHNLSIMKDYKIEKDFYPKFSERELNYGFETFASLPIKLNMTDSTLTSVFPSEFLSVRLKAK